MAAAPGATGAIDSESRNGYVAVSRQVRGPVRASISRNRHPIARPVEGWER